MVLAVVLGSAAGGGFPQWNSNAPACRRARSGDAAARARSQASLAVSANQQGLVRSKRVARSAPADRGDAAVASARRSCVRHRSPALSLTGGDVDAIAGLLHLRERHRFGVYAPSRVLRIIAANPIFDVLAPDCVRRVELPLDERNGARRSVRSLRACRRRLRRTRQGAALSRDGRDRIRD